MAKKYDFNITVLHADFQAGLVIVPVAVAKNVYGEKNVEMTLAEAIAERQRMSDAEKRAHVATLKMRYRDDKAAPGLSKVPRLEVEARA